MIDNFKRSFVTQNNIWDGYFIKLCTCVITYSIFNINDFYSVQFLSSAVLVFNNHILIDCRI